MAPILVSVSYCRTCISLVEAATILSAFVTVGVVMYWCLKNAVLTTRMLSVLVIQIL